MNEQASSLFVSIDIGSTYTKGALFLLKDKGFILQKRSVHPTTIERPLNGFSHVLKNLNPNYPETNDIPIYYSSSAKGGLSIVAIGIVPDLTLQMARMTAYSAGGKIVKVFSYKITSKDVALIDELNPDIILFAGGTDGGNETYNLHNAKMLATLKRDVTIIYAGNKAISDSIQSILKNHDLQIVDNILPELDTPSPDKAKDKIREIFLKKIIYCKGLAEIEKVASKAPYPTPYSMYEYLKKFPIYAHDWQSFSLIDMGGATTDYYSHHKEEEEASVVYKGIKESDTKRSVEGDLGMRVSALAAFDSASSFLPKFLDSSKIEQFHVYVKRVNQDTDYLPANEEEKKFDQLLARICMNLASIRHAGTRKRIFTAHGEAFLQTGKDLRSVSKMIGTGGFLSRPDALGMNIDTIWQEQELIHLIPTRASYFIDKDYLFPMLANLSHDYPEESVNSGVNALVPISGVV